MCVFPHTGAITELAVLLLFLSPPPPPLSVWCCSPFCWNRGRIWSQSVGSPVTSTVYEPPKHCFDLIKCFPKVWLRHLSPKRTENLERGLSRIRQQEYRGHCRSRPSEQRDNRLTSVQLLNILAPASLSAGLITPLPTRGSVPLICKTF